MGWIQGWGVWIYSPSGSVNDPAAYSVPIGSQGSTATTPPNTNPAPSSTPTSVASTPTSTAKDASSAKALITGTLTTYGLGSLADWAWKKWQNGESIDQIMLELRSTKEYKARFPAMDQLSKDGHAISESEYINLEETYISLGRQFGLPSGFYDQPSDFTKLILGHVSASEFQSRLQDYQALVFDTDPTARQELQQFYGIDAGHLAAYFIDPNKALPLIQRQFGAAQAAAAAKITGFGQLDVNQAELISGVDPAQLQQGFDTLVQNRQVFNPLPGEAGQAIDVNEQLDAAFRGDANAQADIERRARNRAAAFAGGGGVAQTQTGFAGAG